MIQTREQNRKNKRTEIEQCDRFMERIQKRAWLLVREANARVKKLNFIPENFLESTDTSL